MISTADIMTVAKREYTTIVRKKSFWISTLLLPLFIVVVGFISGYSSQQAQDKFENVMQFEEGFEVLILDETGNISDEFFNSSDIFRKVENKDLAIEEVKNEDADADVFFYYPESLFTDGLNIEVYRQNESVIENSSYNSTAISIISQSILQGLTPEQSAVSQGSLSAEVYAYEDGKQVDSDFTRLIVPGLGVIIYFLMVVVGINYLLSSISEEKESRMIEILLTSISGESLLIGKLIGLLGVVFTQMVLLAAFGVTGFMFVKNQLPFSISLSDLVFDPVQIAYAVFCVISGFIVLANIMIGVGSAMPTLKEAQSFSSLFMILTIFPMYFAGILMTDPDGSLAKTLSFIPVTAPLVLLFRNAFNVIPPIERWLSMAGLLVQLVVSVYLAVRLFKIGSLEYRDKVNIKSLFGKK
jgi:ABC-2 type transport system permease protein